jgi:hypothetical protein
LSVPSRKEIVLQEAASYKFSNKCSSRALRESNKKNINRATAIAGRLNSGKAKFEAGEDLGIYEKPAAKN